ncbi:uncharacterized protein DUF948 [Alkalibaculum bacchi]|uniref:Uncharacterized protein DUF948 n=1 Tax=Alkalibaculum bacchi TaxID=645887 RepID=A0A366HXV4_9FIRM|nr:DUF948 domain-containing protein [Alkalibaculum bacchi]RBP58611.1 uncharacterized protein DUF948 [Alkalibaculum bacchi]
MFEPIHLWEAGILLIGIAFVVGAVYLAKTMKSLTIAVEDITKTVSENRKQIDDIIKDVQSITNSSSEVMDSVEETLYSVKKSVTDVQKTVATTKSYILRPVLKTLRYTHSAINIAQSLTGKKKKQKIKS